MSDKLESLEHRCATCTYWAGDKKKANTMFAENPVSMHLTEGWPDDGECKIHYESINTRVDGYAYVEIKFDANFGCVHWDGLSNE